MKRYFSVKVPTLTLVIALFVGSASASYAEENNLTKLSCLFEGQGIQHYSGQVPETENVVIEQTLELSGSNVINENHRFVSDYEYMEFNTTRDGLIYGWLEYEVIMTENQITYRSKTIGDDLKSSSTNQKNYYFNTELTINRNTGFGIRKMRHGFSDWRLEYNVSGECKVVTKKF